VLSLAVVMFFACSGYCAPGRLYVMDTPTINILNYGSYGADFRMFSAGSVQTKLNFGVLKNLNIGVSWEVDNFIGNDQMQAAVPALAVKVRLYDGNMTWPGIAVGYDGQGYFYIPNYDGDYMQKGRGIYVVVGRELFFQGLMIDAGLNMNDFSESRVFGFVNAVIPMYQEVLFFMAEYDNINYLPDARLNLGIRYALTDSIDLDFMVRDCWGKETLGKIPNERVFKISYTGKF